MVPRGMVGAVRSPPARARRPTPEVPHGIGRARRCWSRRCSRPRGVSNCPEPALRSLRIGRLTLSWASRDELAEDVADEAWRARQPREAEAFVRWLQSPLPGAPAGAIAYIARRRAAGVLEDGCEVCSIERARTGDSTAICWLCEVLQAQSPTALPGEESRGGAPERKEP